MNVRSQLVQVAEAVTEGLGVELYWLDCRQAPGRWAVKVFIDREAGVTIDDCERVSRALEGPFDEMIERGYDLEVSSPGLDRALHTDRHFDDAVGLTVQVKTFAPIEGQKVWRGRLAKRSGDSIELETDDGPLTVATGDLASARVVPEFTLP